MADFGVQTLLKTPNLTLSDDCCHGTCSHRSPDECVEATDLVFPHRGVYVRQPGQGQAIAEADQVLFSTQTKSTG